MYLLLRVACILVLLGRGYQYLFWDAPFRSLLWDQDLLEPVVNLLGYNWVDYANSLVVDNYINMFKTLNGVLYIIAAVLVVVLHENSKKWIRAVIFFSGVCLVLLALLETKEKFYHFAMFFEHSIQFCLPLIVLKCNQRREGKEVSKYLCVVIVFTFVCHGLYAIGGLYPIPASFITITLNILPISEANAILFLFVAGILDFLIAICIFIPKLRKIALIYAAIWGTITAFARISSGLTYDVSFSIIHQYLYQTIYRLAHGIVPIALLMYLYTSKNKFEHKKLSAVLRLKRSQNVFSHKEM